MGLIPTMGVYPRNGVCSPLKYPVVGENTMGGMRFFGRTQSGKKYRDDTRLAGTRSETSMNETRLAGPFSDIAQPLLAKQ